MRRVLMIALLLTCLVSGAVAFEWLPVTDGLIAAYDFQQGDTPTTLYDISGNGHHGTIYGATWTAEGLQFDGSNDYVNIGDLGSLSGGYTVIAVAKAETNHYGILFNRANAISEGSWQKGLILRKSSAASEWQAIQYDGAALRRASAGGIAPGTWGMVAARWDGANAITLYSSGGPAGAGYTGTLQEHTGDYILGRLVSGPYNWYNGDLAYLAVYDRPLSQTEILQIQQTLRDELSSRSIVIPAPHTPIRPMVAFTLDDSISTDYSTVFPLAEARGIPLTTYVISNRVGNAGYLTWEQLHELRAAGWSVEDHTPSHTDLTSLTEPEIHAAMQAMDAAFLGAGLPHPEHISYPFTLSNDLVRGVVAEYRDTGREGVNGDAIIGWDQSGYEYAIQSHAVVNIQSGSSIAKYQALIDNAILSNEAVVFYTHDVSTTPSTQGCHVDRFADLLDYALSKGDLIDVVTIDGLYRAMQGIRTHPATGPMTLHGETTGATYNSTVDYVGIVWGTTRLNNPEGTAPDASGYDYYWVSPAGEYKEDEFSYTASYTPGTETYYRAAARIDGTWYYGEELTYIGPASLPYVSFTYTADGDETATGTPIHFQSTISGDATSWQWNFGDGTTSTERNPTHTFTATGTYHVTLTASNAYGSSSFSHTFHVYSGTVVHPTLNGSAFKWSPETGYYTGYWFNRDAGFINVEGLFSAILLPFTALIGQWFFMIVWGTLVMGMYLHSQDTTLPFVVGILLGAVISLSAGADGVTVMYLTMAFAGGGVLAKVLLGRL